MIVGYDDKRRSNIEVAELFNETDPFGNKSLGRRFQKYCRDFTKLVMLEIVKQPENQEMLEMRRTLLISC